MMKLNYIQCIDDARAAARRRLPRMMFDFIDGGAGAESATAQNASLLQAVRLQPRVLVNVEQRAIGKLFLGRSYQRPFGIAPMGMCALAWPGADRYLGDAAKRAGIPVCVSTAASMSLEAYREQAGEHAWFQLYVGESHDAAFELVRRAQNAGYEHLILTVDTPMVARRQRELKSGFNVPFRWGAKPVIDLARHPVWTVSTLLAGAPSPSNFQRSSQSGDQSQRSEKFQRQQSRGATDFMFLDRLRERWPGKLIVKGVLSADDAVRIQQAGVDAIYVSNHGGRQLDSAPAAIQRLPLIRQAVGERYPLIFDSGVRCGEGIVKALALGANFVMLGRPFMYALGAAGEAGLNRIIDLLSDDIDRTLAQIGCADVNDLDVGVIADAPFEVGAFRSCNPPTASHPHTQQSQRRQA